MFPFLGCLSWAGSQGTLPEPSMPRLPPAGASPASPWDPLPEASSGCRGGLTPHVEVTRAVRSCPAVLGQGRPAGWTAQRPPLSGEPACRRVWPRRLPSATFPLSPLCSCSNPHHVLHLWRSQGISCSCLLREKSPRTIGPHWTIHRQVFWAFSCLSFSCSVSLPWHPTTRTFSNLEMAFFFLA